MSNANCITRETKPSLRHPTSNSSIPNRPVLAAEVVHRFLGTWRLVGFSQNGQPHPAYGSAPSGTIRYEPEGRMAVQIMPDAACASQAAGPVPGYIAYFGTYRLDPQAKTVAHERVGNVSTGEPRTVLRHYEFLPDGRLALTLDEDATAQVLWQRVQ